MLDMSTNLGWRGVQRTQAGTSCGLHKPHNFSQSFFGSKTEIMTSAQHSANEALSK